MSRMANSDKRTIKKPPCTLDHAPCQEAYLSRNKQVSKECRKYTEITTARYAQDQSYKFLQKRCVEQLRCLRAFKGREDVVVQRWKQKSFAKRLGLLKKACPYIPDHDFDLSVMLDKFSSENVLKQRPKFLTPYLNADLLATDPNALLALAHHNVTYAAEEFRTLDIQQLLLGLRLGAFGKVYVPGSIIMYDESRGLYGRVTTFNHDAVHQRKAYPSILALLMLEARSQVWQFLADVFTSILDETDGRTTSTEWDRLVAEHFGFNESSKVACSPKDAIYFEPLAELSIGTQLAQAQLEFHKDESFSMATSILYFKEELGELKECINSGGNGESRPRADAETAMGAYATKYENICSWHFIEQGFNRLCGRHEAVQAQQNPDERTEEAYASELAALEIQLQIVLFQDLHEINATYFNTPGGGLEAGSRVSADQEEFRRVDCLSWLMWQLNNNHFFMPSILLQVDELLTKPRERRRVGKLILDSLPEIVLFVVYFSSSDTVHNVLLLSSTDGYLQQVDIVPHDSTPRTAPRRDQSMQDEVVNCSNWPAL